MGKLQLPWELRRPWQIRTRTLDEAAASEICKWQHKSVSAIQYRAQKLYWAKVSQAWLSIDTSCYLLGLLDSLAYAEMRLILARVLWNFDLELQPDCRDWSSQKVRSPDWSKFTWYSFCCRFIVSGRKHHSRSSLFLASFEDRNLCLERHANYGMDHPVRRSLNENEKWRI